MSKIISILAGILLPVSIVNAGSYVFNSTVKNWSSAGLELAHSNESLRPVANEMGYLHVEGINWGGSSNPTPSTGAWAGARWVAPPGEVVTQIRVTGYYRRQISSTTDFIAAVYGRMLDGTSYQQLIQANSSSGTIPGNVSYDITQSINSNDKITTLEFRAWEAVAGSYQVAASNAEYSGNINVIEITTTPVAYTLSGTYQFGSTDSNWYAKGLVAAHSNEALRPKTSYTNYLHTEGIYWNGSNYPTPSAGTWGGARWSVPTGECVTQIRTTGYYRRQTSSVTDFVAAVYGKAASETLYNQLTYVNSTNGTIPGTVSYDVTTAVDQGAKVSDIEFRAWQAAAGNLVIAANNAGYSGNINMIQVTTASGLTLGNNNVRLTMTRQGEILQLKDLTTNTDVLSPAASVAWRIDKSNDEIITNLDYGSPTVILGENTITFKWSKTSMPTIIGTVTFDSQKEQFLFDTEILNGTATTLRHVAFPARMEFKADAGNYLAVCSDQNFSSPLKALNELVPFTVVYPGTLYMQMAGFKIGPSSLLVYTDDDDAQVKWMRFRHDNGNVQLELLYRVWLRPNDEWNAPYSTVLKVIPNGTYNELADEYAGWARQQWWADMKLTDKIARTPLLRRYLENGILRMNAGPLPRTCFTQSAFNTQWVYNPNNEYAQYVPFYDRTVLTIAEFEQKYGIQPGWWYPTWAGGVFDALYPNYFDANGNVVGASYMGDFSNFHDKIMNHGSPVMYHMNIIHWPKVTAAAQNSDYWAVTEKGYYYNFAAYNFSWSSLAGLVVSPSVSLPVEMATINRLKDDVGVNGVYLDEIGHAFLTDDNQLSEFYDEPNSFQLQKIQAFQTIRNAVTGPLMTEARNEIILPYMDMGTGANGSPYIDQVPLWELVYGDCVASTTNYGHSETDNRVRYYTWMLGGVMNLVQEWPTVLGTSIGTYLTSSQQKVMSHIVTERMERFDKLGNVRLSQWPSGVVAWNRQTSGSPANIDVDTTLGNVQITNLKTGGIVILTDGEDFCVDSADSVEWDGDVLFTNASGYSLCVTRAGRRWVINNQNASAVNAVILVKSDYGNTSPLSGKIVKTGATVNVQPTLANGIITLQVTIPARDCVVLGEVKTYTFNSAVSNWWSAGLTPDHNNNALRPVTSYTTYLHTEGIYWNGNYPVVAPGVWGGAKWTAPEGEIVKSINVIGSYRRQISSANDFAVAVYGGPSTGTAGDTQLLTHVSSDGTIPGIVSYNQNITVNPAFSITQLQFRAWQAVEGRQIASYNSGYAGNINTIVITTVADGTTAPCQPANPTTFNSTFFTSEELANAAVSGMSADPDGDGHANLMEYALAMNPRLADPPLQQGELLDGFLTLTYKRSKTAADLTCIVEVSNDLQTWQSGPADISTPVILNDDGFTQTIQVKDLTPSSSVGRRFIRLRVVTP